MIPSIATYLTLYLAPYLGTAKTCSSRAGRRSSSCTGKGSSGCTGRISSFLHKKKIFVLHQQQIVVLHKEEIFFLYKSKYFLVQGGALPCVWGLLLMSLPPEDLQPLSNFNTVGVEPGNRLYTNGWLNQGVARLAHSIASVQN